MINQTRFSTVLKYLLALLLLSWGLYMMVFQLFGTGWTYLPGDFGDTRFNLYVLENAHQYVFGGQKSLWNAPMMYPDREVITYSDNLLANILVYSIPRLLGVSKYDSFQIWFLLISALNFICCYVVLATKMKLNPIGAALGSFVFAFSLPNYGQFGHVQVFPRFALPFVLYYLYAFILEFKPSSLLYFLIALVLQFYLGIYLGFLAALVAIFGFAAAIALRVKFNNYFKIQNLIYLILALGLLMPLMLPYYYRTLSSGSRSFEEISIGIPVLKSYLLSPNGAMLEKVLNINTGNWPVYWEHYLFPGISIYIVICATLLLLIFGKMKSKWLSISIISLLLSIVFTTKFGADFTLYKFIFKIPGFSALRAVGRIVFVFLFLYGLIISFFIDYLDNLKWKNQYYKYVLITIISIVIVGEQFILPKDYFKFSKIEAISRESNIEVLVKSNYNKQTHKAFAICYNEQVPAFDYKLHLDAMMASQNLNIPTVNGYSGSCHALFGEYHFTYSKVKSNKWIYLSFVDTNSICYIFVPEK